MMMVPLDCTPVEVSLQAYQDMGLVKMEAEMRENGQQVMILAGYEGTVG